MRWFGFDRLRQRRDSGEGRDPECQQPAWIRSHRQNQERAGVRLPWSRVVRRHPRLRRPRQRRPGKYSSIHPWSSTNVVPSADDLGDFAGRPLVLGMRVCTRRREVVPADRLINACLQTGGPSWDVEAGRRDGVHSSGENLFDDLPRASANVAELTANFAAKGLSQDDMVTLSGETVGTRFLCIDRLEAFMNCQAVVHMMARSACKRARSRSLSYGRLSDKLRRSMHL